MVLKSPRDLALIVLEDLKYSWEFMQVQDLGFSKIIEDIINYL